MKINELIDIQDLRSRLENDLDLLKELSQVFFTDYNKLLQRIDNAIKTKDTVQLIKSAHTIKGAVANFSAKIAYEASLRLENIGKSGNIENADQAFSDLKEIIEETRTALQLMIDKGEW